MKKPFKRVLLHVGPPKTGTTSIQHFLVSNQSALQQRGIYVPAAMRRGVQHIQLPRLFGFRARGTGPSAAARMNEINEQREWVANDFAAEIAKIGGGNTLLLSSELLFDAAEASIDAYRRFFEPYAEHFESLMYLRRQDRWIASSVLQKRSVDLSDEISLGVGSPQAFEQAVRLWDAGSDQCHIRRFDAEFLFHGSLLKDFCMVIGCDDVQPTTVEVFNLAVRQEQVELVDALNRALAHLPRDDRIPYRSRFLPICNEVVGGSPFAFPRAAAKEAFQAYASVNTWLRETRDPDGPVFFFNEDFGDYPVEACNDRTYTVEQLLELSEAIGQKTRELGHGAQIGPGDSDRAALVAHIVSSFIALRDGELEQARARRRSAAIEERRRARLAVSTDAAAPTLD